MWCFLSLSLSPRPLCHLSFISYRASLVTLFLVCVIVDYLSDMVSRTYHSPTNVRNVQVHSFTTHLTTLVRRGFRLVTLPLQAVSRAVQTVF